MVIARYPARLAVCCLLIVCAGCAERRGNGARSDTLAARRQIDARPNVQPVDQSGPLVFNDAQGPSAGGGAPSDNGISTTVEESVRPVEEEGFQGMNGGRANGPSGPGASSVAPPPARNPGTAPDTTGGYQLIGTVLAEVHDAPIFADKVLATIDKVLAAQAARLDENAFRKVAAEAIQKQITEYINTELEFAMALRKLDARDREMARLATIRWREEQIVKAGGSLEVARQRATAAGFDFDELADEQYRWFMRKLYYQKHEYPKIHVSASDMRRYYQENQQKEFTTPDRARFRVIKVDRSKAGGRQEALGEIHRLLDRARSGGKDFGELAAEDNDEESFKRPVEWFQRDSFVVKEVEDAVWKLQPGQITDVIETPDAFYIARLEAKQAGGVKPFEEQDVQRQIEATLRQRQFTALQVAVQQALMRDAIIRYHPRMVELAVGMAMQKYHYWREAAAR